MVALLSFRRLAKGPNARIHIYSGTLRIGEIVPPVKHRAWQWRISWELAQFVSAFSSSQSEVAAIKDATQHWEAFLESASLISARHIDTEVDDVERAVLGAMFLDPGHALDYVHDLHPYHFQSLQHRNIYSVLRGLITIGVDISTITAKPFLEGMSDSGTGNAYTYLSLCASRIVLKDRISDFVRVIISSHDEREIIYA
ncbi:hypothetical protein M8994_17400 [Brucella sp. 21LCYQ03]|nr:hypothetical protein [Brucella sp. 21LCYQ03]